MKRAMMKWAELSAAPAQMAETMNRTQAEMLAKTIMAEGDNVYLQTETAVACSQKRGVYFVRVGRRDRVEPMEFHRYEQFIGGRYHDICRTEREEGEREIARGWRDISRYEARLHTNLLNVASDCRRCAEMLDEAAKRIGQTVDDATEASKVEWIGVEEFNYEIGAALQRIAGVLGGTTLEVISRQLVGLTSAIENVKRLEGK